MKHLKTKSAQKEMAPEQMNLFPRVPVPMAPPPPVTRPPRARVQRAGEMLRDKAIEQVQTHGVHWMDQAVAWVRAWAAQVGPDLRFTAEELRLASLGILPAPHHHNAWGALTMQLIRNSDIVPTGEWISMVAPRSHARRTPRYRFVPRSPK